MTEAWPDTALSLLDSLWATNTSMAVIRRRLTAALGYRPELVDVRALANRFRETAAEPEPVVKAAPKPKAKPKPDPEPVVAGPKAAIPVEAMNYHFAPLPRVDNVVKRVPPGTFAVRGFSMIGGKGR